MSKAERKISSITPVIKSTKAFSNIKTSEDEVSLPKTSKNQPSAKFVHGSFDYDGHTFNFVDCTSNVMGIHQISTSFNFKLKKGYEKTKLFEVVNKLNETRVGIKTIIDETNTSSAKIKFSVEIISVGEEVTKDKIVVIINILSSNSDVFWEMISDIREP